MSFFAPPRRVETTVFTRLPERFRKSRPSAWADANRDRVEIDSFLRRILLGYKTQHLVLGKRRAVECSSGLQPRKTTTPYGKSLSRRSVLAKPMRCRAI
jgi:hypothetical protein